MKFENILIGLLSGVFVLMILMPIINVFGLNKITYLILLYSLPITGVVAITVDEKFSIILTRGVEDGKKDKNEFVGKRVLIYTSSGCTYRGKLVSTTGDILRLDNARRIDIPNSLELDHLFISKNDVRKIETV